MMQQLVWVLFVSGVLGLYEDQVFKFDWRKQFLGKIEDLEFYGTDPDPILVVGTKRNVVAALDSDHGRIIWRHKFEEDNTIGRLRKVASLGKYVVSVSGTTQLFLRLWQPEKGALMQEHLVRPKRNPDLVHLSKSKIWTIFTGEGSVEITSYSFDSKKIVEANTVTVQSGSPLKNCIVGSGEMLVCMSSDKFQYVSMKTGDKFELLPFSSERRVDVNSAVVRGSFIQIETDGPILTYRCSSSGLEFVSEGTSLLSECPGLKVDQECLEGGTDSEGFTYCAKYAKDIKVNYKTRDIAVKVPVEHGKLENVWTECSVDPDAFQLILSFEDGALVSATPRGNIMFTREEGLASIQKVEMVGMGFQDQDFQMRLFTPENMFDPASLAQNFFNRIRRHISQLKDLLRSLTTFRLTEKKSSTPDRFGLNKIIVAATEHNKLYGIESISGNILWETMYPGRFDPSLPSYQPQTYLLIQKDGRSGDYAQAVLVYKHARSVHYMLTFNPLTGKVISNEPLELVLDQALLLPELTDHELKPVLIIGKDGSASIHPANAISCLKTGPPLYVATKAEPGTLVGKKVGISEDSQSIVLSPVWSLVSANTEILSVRSRSTEERIHSAGRVLADRSVLFKYMNPNLAMVVAQGTDSSAKVFINVYLLDLVTGRIFYSASHKKVVPPFHVIHSENWAVYSFFNDKARRTELVSLELYEGKSQSNASVFSSVENTVNPLVERQAYILPTSDITSMRETVTEQGITSKHLLIGTSLGTVLDLPIHMVDPRRPPLDSPPHVREPGIPPYIPELPIPHESILNYNQTLLGVNNIVTSPSGLESTTLVFIHGLDLYGTRVTPSKGFDLLKEDFDYLMITAVIAGLALASFITRKFSQKKMLTQAWK